MVLTRDVIRFAFLVVSLIGAVSTGACGNDEAGSGSSGSSEDKPRVGLTPAQYSALEGVYVAPVPWDKLDSAATPPSHARVQALARPVVAKCDPLDTDDALLSAMRETCLAAARFLIASYAPVGCRTAKTCAEGFAEARDAGNAMIEASRASDRAIDAARIPTACKDAMLTPEAAYAYYERLDARVRSFVDALRAESEPRVRSAAAALRRLGDADVPSNRESLTRFRARCR